MSILDSIEDAHKKLLYTSVRVRTDKAGGSGTVIYSKICPVTYKDPKYPELVTNEGEHETYVLTNHHVIDSAISIKEAWNSFAQREVPTEFRDTVTVEFFKYKDLSKLYGRTTIEADIVAWDEREDLALLKLRMAEPAKYVATMYPRGKEKDMKLFMETVAIGCSLGHPPLFTTGRVTSMHDEIDNKEYYMSDSQIIFGNSGGSMFLAETGDLIGIPARVASVNLGFGVDIVTFMGYFITVERIYNFIEKQGFQFIYDSSMDSALCAKKRLAKIKREEQKLVIPKK